MSRKEPTWTVKGRQKGTKHVVTVTLGRCDLITHQEARRRAKAALFALSQGRNPNEEQRDAIEAKKSEERLEEALNLTLADACEAYFGYKDYKPNTIKCATQTLTRNFGDWMDRPLRSITRDEVLVRFKDIKKRVTTRRASINERNAKLGLPPSRFSASDGAGESQRAFRYLTAIFNSFKKDSFDGRLLLPQGNPCDVLADKKLRKVLKPRNSYLTDDSIDALIETLGIAGHDQYVGPVTKQDADFMTLLLFTGLRVNEARTLRWSDIDFRSSMFRVEDTKNHSSHTLPMTNTIKRTLRSRFDARVNDDKYVFPAKRDGNLPASMSRSFERVCQATGFKFTPHDLRRTFATVASEMGVDIYRIGAALNHSKQGVTAGYIQTTMNMLKETLEAIETAILKPYTIENQQAVTQDINEITRD